MRAADGFDGNGAETVRAFPGGRVGGRRGFLHLVSGFDDQEDEEGNKNEIYDGLQKCAPSDRGLTYGNCLLAEVYLSEQQTDDRRQEVIDEGTYDLAKCGADDDAHGEIEHVSAHDEFPEFL